MGFGVLSFLLLVLTIGLYPGASQVDPWSQFLVGPDREPVEREKLIHTYSLVCPLNTLYDSASTSGAFIYNSTGNELDDCVPCDTDMSCLVNGTCCPDDPRAYLGYGCTTTLVQSDFTIGDIENETKADSFLMVTSCPQYADQDLKEKCESGSNNTDSDMNMPVTSTYNMVTYKNMHCAECNGELSSEPWFSFLQCQDPLDFSALQELTPSEIKSTIELAKCILAYDVGPPFSEFKMPCSSTRDPIRYIDKCNATGSWEDFDADIEWACAHYFKPFRKYKNVFCYICNPTLSSKHNDQLIDRCNVTGQWTNYEAEAEWGCDMLPRIYITNPYKNVYCMLCNGVSNVNFSQLIATENFTIAISETMPSLNYGFANVSVHFNESSGNITTLMSDFLENILFTMNERMNITIKSHEDYMEVENFSDLIADYSQVCLDQPTCDYVNTSSGLKYQTCGSCSCGITCAANHTCCIDLLFETQPYSCLPRSYFPRLTGDTRRGTPADTNACDTPDCQGQRIEPKSEFLVIDKCLDRAAPPYAVFKCENTEEDHKSDLLSFLPVSTELVVPYKNVYCWICNGGTEGAILTFEILCADYIDWPMFQDWKEMLRIVMQLCTLVFKPPETSPCCTKLDDVTLDSAVDNCQSSGGYSNYTSSPIERYCTDPSSAMSQLPGVRFEQTVFRNPFCFLCRSIGIKDVDLIVKCNQTTYWEVDSDSELVLIELCEQTGWQESWFPYKNGYCYECNAKTVRAICMSCPPDGGGDPGNAYRRLFTVNPEEWDAIMTDQDIAEDCVNGTYDKTLRSCRGLYCNGNRVLKNGTCGHVFEYAANMFYSLYFRLTPVDVVPVPLLCMASICDAVDETIRNETKSLGTLDINACVISTSSSCRDNGMGNCPLYRAVDAKTPQELLIFLLINVETTNQRNVLEQELSNYASYKFKVNGGVIDYFFLARPESKASVLFASRFKAPDDEPVYMKCVYFRDRFTAFNKALIPLTRISLCAQVELTENEYTIDNSTKELRIGASEAVLVADQFVLMPGKNNARVCRDEFTASQPEGDSGENLLQRYYSVFTYVFIGISLLCLLLTFITYCLFPSLRTIPGQNNMNLTCALFSAQALLQFGLWANENKIACILIGMFIHFFWMVTFCAMNVCSFHMFRIFCFIMSPDSHSSGGRSLFRNYLLYSYGLPFFLVLFTGSVHMIQSDGLYSGYGPHTCFISHALTTILAFIVPASLMFVSNIVFFSITAHKIRVLPNVQSSARNRREFVLYVKLCTLTGISWPLQMVDSNLPLSAFSFIVAFVNFLQGLFIFLSYCCNLRVAQLYRELISRRLGLKGAATTKSEANQTRTTATTLQ